MKKMFEHLPDDKSAKESFENLVPNEMLHEYIATLDAVIFKADVKNTWESLAVYFKHQPKWRKGGH